MVNIGVCCKLLVITMNNSIQISEQNISLLANDFIHHEAFSVFGKNKHSKLYNLFAIALGAKHGYGNLKASCKFQPFSFKPEAPDIFEIARRGASDDKRLDSSIPLAHLYFELTSDVDLVANLIREYMLCQLLSRSYQIIKHNPHDQYDLINGWIDLAKGFPNEYMDGLKINTKWATIDIDGIWLGEMVDYSLLGSSVNKELMMAFVSKTNTPYPDEFSQEIKATLGGYFANVKFCDLANVLLSTFTKIISEYTYFDAKAFVINNVDYDDYIGMRCLDDNGYVEIDYKLFDRFMIKQSSTMCRMVEINDVQYNTLKQIFRNNRISDKERAMRVGGIYLGCLMKSTNQSSGFDDWNHSVEQYKSKYLN